MYGLPFQTLNFVYDLNLLFMRMICTFFVLLAFCAQLLAQQNKLRVKALPFYYPEKTIHGQAKILISVFALEKDISERWAVQAAYGLVRNSFVSSSSDGVGSNDSKNRVCALDFLRYHGNKHIKSWFTSVHIERIFIDRFNIATSGRPGFNLHRKTTGVGVSMGKNFKITKRLYFQTSVGVAKEWSKDNGWPIKLYSSEIYRAFRNSGFYPRGYFVLGFEI
jgi:hypothetical protein